MTNIQTNERINLAHEVYDTFSDEMCDKVRNEQWTLVENGDINMDDAFILTVERFAA